MRRSIGWGALLAIGLVSCTKTVKLQAGKDLNPSKETKKAAPVTIWICQLKGDAAFRKAGDQQLIPNRKAALGDEFLTETEKSLNPLEPIELTGRDLFEETKYVGVVANFESLEGDDWKAIIPIDEVNKKSFQLDGYKVSIVGR